MALMNTAIILAGGKSTRMGFDKQLITIEGVNITKYIIRVLKSIFE
ncbi:MAG: molybdenum cofactor guanylyltransferase, partial [Candidatus Cloacimonadaceae bacterium]